MVTGVLARIYVRVSSDREQGRSVQGQEVECRGYCEREGHTVAEIYCDNNIGATRWSGKDRPAWAKLKRDLGQGELLVVWEASRGYRDLEEFVVIRNLCTEKGALLAYSGRILNLAESEDRFVGGLDALLAEREGDKIRDRVLRGQRHGRTLGRPHTRPPWGYRIKSVEGVRVPGVWEPDPVEAPRLREAVARLLNGETQWMVQQWLEATGWAPSSPTYLATAVSNPAYVGRRTHKGEDVGKGTWKPLITQGQHDGLVQRMRRMKNLYGYHHPPGQEPKYLLSGIAICGGCEEGLKHTRMGGKGDFYQCPKYGHVTRKAETMDRAVEDALFEWAVKKDWPRYDTEDPAVAAAESELEELEGELAQWRRLAKERKVSPVSFAENELSLLAQIAEIKPKTISTRTRLDGIDFEHIEQAWPLLSMRQKRDIVRGTFTIRAVPATKGKRDGKLLVEEV